MKQMDGRTSLIQAISDEMGKDIDLAFVAAVDKILIRLWMFGYRIEPFDEGDVQDEQEAQEA
jgi:hypothetical protein